jgi:hypothetical protein
MIRLLLAAMVFALLGAVLATGSDAALYYAARSSVILQ